MLKEKDDDQKNQYGLWYRKKSYWDLVLVSFFAKQLLMAPVERKTEGRYQVSYNYFSDTYK